MLPSGPRGPRDRSLFDAAKFTNTPRYSRGVLPRGPRDRSLFDAIILTNNWKYYSKLLKEQAIKRGDDYLRPHGYRLDRDTIVPVDIGGWYPIRDPIRDPINNVSLQQAWKRVCEHTKYKPLIKRPIIIVSAPRSIESGFPHTYVDPDDASQDPCYIVLPRGHQVDLRTMIHECVHVFQKRTGITKKYYLNETYIQTLLDGIVNHNLALRFNPDATPIEYSTGMKKLWNVKDETAAPLEKKAYDITQLLLPLGTLGI